jgi:hypothetical protein
MLPSHVGVTLAAGHSGFSEFGGRQGLWIPCGERADLPGLGAHRNFDLFLEIATPSFSGRTLSLSSQRYGKLAGLALIVLGSYDCRRRHPLQDDGEKH